MGPSRSSINRGCRRVSTVDDLVAQAAGANLGARELGELMQAPIAATDLRACRSGTLRFDGGWFVRRGPDARRAVSK